MSPPRAASAPATSPLAARGKAGPPDDVAAGGGGGVEAIGATSANGKRDSTACTVGGRAGATRGPGAQYARFFLCCFLCPAPACLGGASAGAGAGAQGTGAGAGRLSASRAAAGGGGGGGELGVAGAGRSATCTSIFLPPRQCPGAPQMK